MSDNPTINLDDSKSELWQWDTGRYLSLPDTDAKEVHISRGGMRSARVVKIQEQKAVIPDGLLVFGGRLFVYVVQANATGEMTVYDKWFDIQRRPKPDDYIYTDDEVRQWEQLEERLSNIESNGVVMSHEKLLNRDSDDQHPISAITGLTTALNNNSSAASEAMRAAQAAGSAASAAQDTANTAVENAGKAQQAADDAASVAEKAQTSADNAQTAAEKAQGSADKAQETADSATTAATELGKRLGAAEKELEGKQPAGDYLTSESDPTVPEWAKQPDKPTYTATEVGALPSSTKIPSKTSELENDAEYAKTSELPQIDVTLEQSGQAAEAAETGKRIEAISPDDSVINGKPWSSKQIIDTLCPPLEETGNPVQCYPVTNYPLGIKASWGPTQAGSGDPSPDNIRPISGRDSVTVERCGENLLDISQCTAANKDAAYDMDVSIDDSGLISISGIPRVTAYAPKATYRILFTNQIILATDYKAKTFVVKGAVNGIARIAADKSIVISTPLAPDTPVDIQLRLMYYVGAEPSTYSPYQGIACDLALPETVYGGEVDAVTGAGHKMWENIATYAGETLPGKWISDRDVYAVGATPTVGAQVVYKLAEPVSFEATGGQPVAALPGVNTVLTDADSVTVTGRADTIKRITDLEDAVASITTTEG